MNTVMWEHPVTATHIQQLESWGVTVIATVVKKLACGDYGDGAMAQVDTIAHKIKEKLK